MHKGKTKNIIHSTVPGNDIKPLDREKLEALRNKLMREKITNG